MHGEGRRTGSLVRRLSRAVLPTSSGRSRPRLGLAPRLLHVHTCGAYAPGEICWNLLDPTITLDGVALWSDGRLHPDRIPGGAAVLDGCPELAALFAQPATAVGID